MPDCLFCRIASGELESEVVADSENVMAFRDINPAAPTHVLVVPKRHVASVKEVGPADAELLAEMFEVMNRIAEQQRVEGGFRIVTNVGSDAGQSVQHLHFHLIGGRPMGWPPG